MMNQKFANKCYEIGFKDPSYKAVPRSKARFMRGLGWKVFEDDPKKPGLIMIKAF